MDLAQELFKMWGPPGIITVILWVFLTKSEKREDAKDQRIRLLENQLFESYDERISAANSISEALHSNALAMNDLTNEIRSRR